MVGWYKDTLVETFADLLLRKQSYNQPSDRQEWRKQSLTRPPTADFTSLAQLVGFRPAIGCSPYVRTPAGPPSESSREGHAHGFDSLASH